MGELAGNPTNFVPMIWNSMWKEQDLTDFIQDHEPTEGLQWFLNNCLPGPSKPHTIRAGKRWRPGVMIDFWINMRTKDQFRFAPRVPVVSVQDILIKYKNNPSGWEANSEPYVMIEKTWFYPDDDSDRKVLTSLAINDGFPNVDAFFKWFDSDFEGQIIHWTDLKY